MPDKKKTYPPLHPAYAGAELRPCRLDGDAARALHEAAELAQEVTGTPIKPFSNLTKDAEGIVRFALALLADELERLENASDTERRAFVDRLIHHFELHTSRAKLEADAEKAAKDREWKAELARKREARERREAAERAVAEEEEAEREARVQEKLTAAGAQPSSHP